MLIEHKEVYQLPYFSFWCKRMQPTEMCILFQSRFHYTLTTGPLKFAMKKQVPETTEDFFPNLWCICLSKVSSHILFIKCMVSHQHDTINLMDQYEDW